MMDSRDALLESGLAHHQAGRLNEATTAYGRILDTIPHDADALHLTGVAAYQSGQYALAIEYITRAIAIKPRMALYHNNLASAYQALKLPDQAIHSATRSLELNPELADGHYNLGVILSSEGEPERAEASFRKVLLLRPDFVQAHFNLGILLRRANRFSEAAACFQQVLLHDPENSTAQFLCATMGGYHIDRAPEQYVTDVFDADAAAFDEKLVQVLQYDTPQRLCDLSATLLGNAGETRDILDLGCGTGLVGTSFAPYAKNLVGVDLSPNMLKRAEQRGIYQRLLHGDLLPIMQNEANASYDVIVAADVFIYLGRLDEVFAEVKRLLRIGGLFAFSVESLDALINDLPCLKSEETYRLNHNGRFAHSSIYINILVSRYGFFLNTMTQAPARLENGKSVQAWLILLES